MKSIQHVRDHGLYLWLKSELNALIDNALAVSTQYDWINNEDDKKIVFQIMERDITYIANEAAKKTVEK